MICSYRCSSSSSSSLVLLSVFAMWPTVKKTLFRLDRRAATKRLANAARHRRRRAKRDVALCGHFPLHEQYSLSFYEEVFCFLIKIFTQKKSSF